MVRISIIQINHRKGKEIKIKGWVESTAIKWAVLANETRQKATKNSNVILPPSKDLLEFNKQYKLNLNDPIERQVALSLYQNKINAINDAEQHFAKWQSSNYKPFTPQKKHKVSHEQKFTSRKGWNIDEMGEPLLSGELAHIEYVDFHGEITEREISNWTLYKDYLVGFCLLRRETRTFRRANIIDWQPK